MITSINNKQSRWQLQDAKSRFSKIVKMAEGGEPQLVTRHGVPTVYIVEARSYDRLMQKSANRKDVLSESPFKDIDLIIERSKDEGREVIL